MSARLNLSRRNAWFKVLRYGVVWLCFWLILGLADSLRAVSPPSRASAEAAGLPQAPVLIEVPRLLWGKIWGKPGGSTRVLATGSIDRSVTSAPRVAAGKSNAGDDAADTYTDRAVPDVIANSPTPALGEGFFAAPPAGFDDLIGVQNTQADVFFQGRLLISSFIEFDLEYLEFTLPEEVIEAIPTLKNPGQVLNALSGQLDSNSHLLCNLRVRENCGELKPEVAGVIFDEGKFRIDLFVAPSQLAVQLVEGDRYLPAPSASWATLHDVGLTASGQQDIHQFSVAGESYLSKGAGRARVRYGLTNTGPALHEVSWQWDNKDEELEAGVFRGARGNSLFINDKRLLGLRLGLEVRYKKE